MKKYLVTLLLSLFVIAANLFSQNAGTKLMYKEKIILHTDRPLYHAGEMMWFSIYVTGGVLNQPSLLSRAAYVEVIDSSGTSIASGICRLDGGRGQGALELPHTLKPSLYKIVAYTRWMRNFSSEHFFYQVIPVVNGYMSKAMSKVTDNTINLDGTVKIEISSDKLQCGLRDQVNVSLSLSEIAGNSLTGDVSVSVYRNDFETDLLRQTAAQVPENTETHTDFVFKFEPEYLGQWITAQVVNKSTGDPLPDIHSYLVVPGYASGFFNAKSDRTGLVKFQLNEPLSADSIIILAHADSAYNIIPVDPFVRKFPPFRTPPASVLISNESVSDMRNHVEVQRAFNSEAYFSREMLSRDTTPFYGTHDLTYLLDDYTRFPTMEEVLREYVQLVAVHKRNGNFHLTVFNEPYGKMFDADPLILIDGYPVLNPDRLFAFDPLKVKSIDVVARRYFRGSSVFDGILNLTTYTRNLNSFQIDNNALTLKNHLVAPAMKFTAPIYEEDVQKSSRIPDFRHLLMWNPMLKLNSGETKQLAFYTSDVEGEYIISVNGITNDGKLITGQKSFNVNRGD